MSEQKATAGQDVVDLLKAQHQQIRQLFLKVDRAAVAERAEAFGELVRLLAVHETAEEEVVHPMARQALGENGGRIVDDRLAEERQAKEVLSRLDGMDPGDPEFVALFHTLRDAVLSHAEHEERMEFERLRGSLPKERLVAMAKAVRAAEAVAPTHPHPGVESAKANLLAGPPAALLDRVRDAVRKAVS